MRLLETYANPDFSLDEIVEIIKTDPAITAKVLKLANSAFYGGGWIDTLNRAVLWLGRHSLTCLVLSFSLAEEAQRPGPYANLYKEYWLQSVLQAIGMQLLMQPTHPALSDAAFAAGLVLDIGRLVMLHDAPQTYAEICETTRRTRRPLVEIEQEVLQQTHASASAELLGAWGFPSRTVRLAESHHLPIGDVLEAPRDDAFEWLVAANIASATADFLSGLTPAPSLEKIQVLCATQWGLDDRAIDAYLENVRSRLSETADLFSTSVSQLPSPAELLAGAREHLASLSLRSDGEAEEAGELPRAATCDQLSLGKRIRDLEQKECIDDLTGVYNRDYFQRRLLQRLQAKADPARLNAVVFLDVDDYRRISNSAGHQAGDSVLRTAAAALLDNVRETDVVARYNGGQFVILLQCANEGDVHKTVARLRTSIGEAVVRAGGREIRVTASVGGAIQDATEGDAMHGAARLLALADQALYEAKHGEARSAVLHCVSEELAC